MSKMKRAACMVMALMLIVSAFALPIHVRAAGYAYVYVSSTSIYVGDSVTFTVGTVNAAGEISVSGAVSDHDWFDRSSKSYTVNAVSPGTITVTISGTIADYDSAQDMQVYESASVTVLERPVYDSGTQEQTQQQQEEIQQPEQPSLASNAALSALSVSAGTLSPEFSADTTEYELSLPSGTEKIEISASAADDAAAVSGAGEHQLDPGNNDLSVQVRAEDGTTRTYVIHAYVEETPEVYLEYGGKQLGVVKNTADVAAPADSFEKTTITVEGKEIDAWTSTLMNRTVIYLIDEESGARSFYLYDEESGKVTSIFRPMALLGNALFIVDVPENLQEREGMTFTTVSVDEQELPGWTFDDPQFSDYALIYAMNEKGELNYYQYEKTQNTLQLYSGAAAISEQAYAREQQREQIFIIAAGVFAASTIIALIACILIRMRCDRRIAHVIRSSQKGDEA